MAVNTVQVENGKPVLDNQESILMSFKDVQLSIHDMNKIPELMKNKRKGEVFLTQRRVIFLSKDQSKPLKSFSLPFQLIEGFTVEQGLFSSNYIKGRITAQPEGGWEGQATFRLTFYSGGAVDFAKTVVQVANPASRNVAPYGPVVYVYETIRVIPVRNQSFLRSAGPVVNESRSYAYVPASPPPQGGYYMPTSPMYGGYGYPPPMYYNSMQTPPNFPPFGQPGMPPMSASFTSPAFPGYAQYPPPVSTTRMAVPQTFSSDSSPLFNQQNSQFTAPLNPTAPTGGELDPYTTSTPDYNPSWYSVINQPHEVTPSASTTGKIGAQT
ncbi:WW domain-binding protein 2-like isoform X2 [Leucoraja erinacea]|uniref:WW domain-binding protein 2-like isoform X2 n=1 Tax=Leucoraja erinaceus TaxID=7782 RepID=UPI00245616B6|nr:WW domain-binding protein 2-like isoform X2 [Leucoraja erinacea]